MRRVLITMLIAVLAFDIAAIVFIEDIAFGIENKRLVSYLGGSVSMAIKTALLLEIVVDDTKTK